MKLWTILGALLVLAGIACAQPAAIMRDVRVDDQIGAQLPLDLHFKDEDGKDVKLGDFFGKKPVVLILVFYKCGGTCTKELEEAVSSFKAMKTYDIGRDFEVVTVSIHPKEGPELSKMKDDIYDEKYNRPTGRQGWHFLTGDWASIKSMTDTVGFRFKYDEKANAIQHPNTLIIVTPSGKVSQYFHGLIYPPRLVLTALKKAETEEIGEPDPTDITGCVQGPSAGPWTPVVNNALKIGGILFLAGVGYAIFSMSRKRPEPPDITSQGGSSE